MKITCRRNPLMLAHEHRRENGSLVCVGYQPLDKMGTIHTMDSTEIAV